MSGHAECAGVRPLLLFFFVKHHYCHPISRLCFHIHAQQQSHQVDQAPGESVNIRWDRGFGMR